MKYLAPKTTKEAVALMAKAKHPAFVLAGGTDLMVAIKNDFIEPAIVVYIKKIPAMRTIRKSATGFRIGAGVTAAEMAEHRELSKAWPGVVESAGLIGSDQIQNRCTVAGNLCNASPAADSVPALIAAGAKVRIVGPKGSRTIPVEKFVVGPGVTTLTHGEIVDSITLPKQVRRSADAYLRFIPRSEMDIAVVGAAVSLNISAAGIVQGARIALGAVAPTALLVKQGADAIIGSKLDKAAITELANVCELACAPIDDKRGTVAFRKEVAGVLARRAAKIAYRRAGGH